MTSDEFNWKHRSQFPTASFGHIKSTDNLTMLATMITTNITEIGKKSLHYESWRLQWVVIWKVYIVFILRVVGIWSSNKPRTAKFGAISKDSKRRKDFKTVKEGLSGLFESPVCCKIRRGPLETLKNSKKNPKTDFWTVSQWQKM